MGSGVVIPPPPELPGPGIAIFVQPGYSIDYTPTIDLPYGQVVVCGTWVAITIEPIPANTLGALHTCGVFFVDKPSGESIAFGQDVYWDDTAQLATGVSTGNTVMGKCVRSTLPGDDKVRVMLTPGLPN